MEKIDRLYEQLDMNTQMKTGWSADEIAPFIDYLQTMKDEGVLGTVLFTLDARCNVLTVSMIEERNSHDFLRSVYRTVIYDAGLSLVIGRIHETGLEPTDEEVSEKYDLIDAMRIMEISLLEHIIVSRDSADAVSDSLPSVSVQMLIPWALPR